MNEKTELLPSMEGAPPTEAAWISPRGIEYRKQEGRWRRYSTPGHWNSSMTLTPLDDEILDALMTASTRSKIVKPGDCIHCGKEICNDLGWCNSFKAASPSSKSTKEADRLHDALEDFDNTLSNWARAYPLSVFPEPDWDAVRVALQAAGITVDSVSGSNMRHVAGTLNREFQKIRAALASSSIKEDGERAARLLTEDELLTAIRSCGSEVQGRIALTYESGPYSIDRTTVVCDSLARAIQQKFMEVNSLSSSPPSPLGDTPKLKAALRQIADFDAWSFSDRQTVYQMRVIAKAALGDDDRAPLGDTPDQQEQKR